MTLKFLDFDLSEDASGLQSWSALAAPANAHRVALEQEVQALLEDLQRELGAPGPVDEGHAWDLSLETAHDALRSTVSLHLTGTAALADRLAHWTDA